MRYAVSCFAVFALVCTLGCPGTGNPTRPTDVKVDRVTSETVIAPGPSATERR